MEEILAKYFSNEASKEEISLVESWRSDTEENAKAFLEAKNIWVHTSQLPDPPQAILQGILKEKPHQGKQVSIAGFGWIKYAAAAAVVFAIGLAILLLPSSDSELNTSKLADGSQVVLHRDSKVDLIAFNDEVREVRISGKAYFDIERDENRPFIIHANNAEVKVLGTSFVVDSYNSKTEVCVESGLVELLKDGENLSIKLSKGEMGIVSESNKGIIKKNIRNPNYLSWKTKVLTFKENSMKEVASAFEDVYGISVQFENQEFKNCKLTAKFNKKKAKDALEILARTFDIEYEFKGGLAILKGKGC